MTRGTRVRSRSCHPFAWRCCTYWKGAGKTFNAIDILPQHIWFQSVHVWIYFQQSGDWGGWSQRYGNSRSTLWFAPRNHGMPFYAVGCSEERWTFSSLCWRSSTSITNPQTSIRFHSRDAETLYHAQVRMLTDWFGAGIDEQSHIPFITLTSLYAGIQAGHHRIPDDAVLKAGAKQTKKKQKKTA